MAESRMSGTLVFPAPDSKRSVLQRRDSVSNILQAVLDGMAIIVIAYLLVDFHIGAITTPYLIMLLLLLGALAVAYDRFGIYRSYASVTSKALSILKAWVATFAFLFVLAFLTSKGEEYSRLLLGQLFVLGYLAQLLLHLASRWLQRSLLKHGHQAENAVIVGSGPLANFLFRKMSTNPWLGQDVLGCVLIDKDAEETEKPGARPRVLGVLEDLMELIDKHDIRAVYIVTPLDASVVLKDLYFKLLDKHVAVHWVPDIFSLRLVNHSVREIAGVPVLTLSETPLTGTRRVLKSIEDFVLSLLILILIALPLLAIAIAIKLNSPGPVFFRQRRMGWNGKVFRIWKFRSMFVHQAENDVVKQAQRGDPRVTRVGAFIRRTSLDELPQVFNVLMGDMSLVGPRPHAIQHDMEYSRQIDDYFARHNLKPGITGLAQVRGFRGETRDIEQMIQRVEADIEYINHWSVWLDLSILARTVTVFGGKNAY